MRIPRTLGLLLATACLLLLAMPALAASTPTAPSSPNFDDREILGVLQTVNLGEINGGEKAKAMAASADVKAYALEMVRDHRQGENGVKSAVKSVGATQTSTLSRTLRDQSNSTMAHLSRLKGRSFDRGYVDAQVTMHQQVLDAIDRDLMPKAQSAGVKALLTSTRATVAEHLEKARALRQKLGG